MDSFLFNALNFVLNINSIDQTLIRSNSTDHLRVRLETSKPTLNNFVFFLFKIKFFIGLNLEETESIKAYLGF